MKILITGVCGMIGSHLAPRLIAEGHEVHGTFYKPTIDMRELSPQVRAVEMDVRYALHVQDVIGDLKPDWIFHLAAQSYPSVSWVRPEETIQTNVVGTLNVFEAVRHERAVTAGYDPVVVVASSSAGYGASLLTATGPISEEAEMLPLHPYGVSKVATDLLAFQYFSSNGIRALRARIFNTSGPRKRGDVISDFSRRVAALPAQGGELRVGSLTTRRAFLHVDDTVAALIAIAERGKAGEAYNISGAAVVSIQELIPMFEAASGRKITPSVDQALLRPTDEPIIWGSTKRLSEHTGWKQQRAVAEIVRDVYDYEAAKARESEAGA